MYVQKNGMKHYQEGMPEGTMILTPDISPLLVLSADETNL